MRKNIEDGSLTVFLSVVCARIFESPGVHMINERDVAKCTSFLFIVNFLVCNENLKKKKKTKNKTLKCEINLAHTSLSL